MAKNGSGEGSNILPDRTALKKCMKGIEDCLDRIATLKGEYMASCKEIREEMKEIYADAKEKGVITRAVKQLIETRILQSRIQEGVEKLDVDDVDVYWAYADAVLSWDDTPLARAAARPVEEIEAAQ